MVVLIVWLGTRRMQAQIQAQSELRKQLLDKFATAQELTTFLESGAGQQFLGEMRWRGAGPVRFLPGGDHDDAGIRVPGTDPDAEKLHRPGCDPAGHRRRIAFVGSHNAQAGLEEKWPVWRTGFRDPIFSFRVTEP